MVILILINITLIIYPELLMMVMINLILINIHQLITMMMIYLDAHLMMEHLATVKDLNIWHLGHLLQHWHHSHHLILKHSYHLLKH